MAKLQKLTYQTWDKQTKSIDFLGPDPNLNSFNTTLLTGHNGSHKSSILRQLVAILTNIEDDGSLTFFHDGDETREDAISVICASGSIADRFPSKENGGHRTDFDVPNYVYIGQRVGANLLSKKLPLETAITFALNSDVRDRFHLPFYEKAYRFAGITPRLDLTFRRRTTSKRDRDGNNTLLDFVQRRAKGEQPLKNDPRSMSQATAEYLTTDFAYESFIELSYFLSGKGRGPIKTTFNEQRQIISAGLSTEAIRLGLLSDQLILADAQVQSRRGGKSFSIYDLSSGEYHLFTTILALGFSMRAGSIVLIDEPENSLHPHWQQEFMDTLRTMCSLIKEGHVVISTHSPLIVSAASENSRIVDLSWNVETPATLPVAFGASADEILFSQFGIASSRNPIVVDIVQQAVALAELEQTTGPEFESLRLGLQRISMQLQAEDPLKDVVDALLESEA